LPDGSSQRIVAAKGEAPGDVLRRADEALYEAKAAGRNRINARFGPAPKQVKVAKAAPGPAQG
jgi:predicted signal transduction protein with EAL and GGDEF domain